MTVYKISEHTNSTYVNCNWFDRLGHLKEGCFLAPQLVVVRS